MLLVALRKSEAGALSCKRAAIQPTCTSTCRECVGYLYGDRFDTLETKDGVQEL